MHAHGHTRRLRHGTASYYAVPDQPKALHDPGGFQQPVTSPPCQSRLLQLTPRRLPRSHTPIPSPHAVLVSCHLVGLRLTLMYAPRRPIPRSPCASRVAAVGGAHGHSSP
ncbi:hypothetical protein BDA96_09G185600 [Sorghum bicolor]|uniref:Uncharacterized protein n=2 Tax=Sorghum bicolor TaxID=4558 RepID=A0A921QDX1_SORBI|nr:hypothetical protein BDA96_09G185600 [Sorghum bicolor]KXG22229.1 hypothetical protein SORBI_3009G176100 [Sorghum bicolor]